MGKIQNDLDGYQQTGFFYTGSVLSSWLLWGIGAYLSYLPESTYTAWVSFFGAAGLCSPAILSMVMVRRNADLWKDFKRKCLSVPRSFGLAECLALFLMPASILLAQLLSLMGGYSVSQFYLAEHFSFTSGVFPVWAMLLVAPLIEEFAWHSYGTDCLHRRYCLLKTSLLFALFWGAWHIPLSFIKDYYQSNLVVTGWIYSANFMLSLFPYVIIMNWIYYKTEKNIWLMVIFHSTAGLFNELFQTHPDSKIIQTGLLCLLAIYLIRKEPEIFFGNKSGTNDKLHKLENRSVEG